MNIAPLQQNLAPIKKAVLIEPTAMYQGSGGIELGGAALIIPPIGFTFKFGIGEIAYSKKKARIGKLEKVAIKKVEQVQNNRYKTYGGYEESRFRYYDTFNDIWFEEDLCWADEAIELAETYWEQVANGTLIYARERGCTFAVRQERANKRLARLKTLPRDPGEAGILEEEEEEEAVCP